ncbi:hypothetical protein ZWY2020_010142 [Hordeum vulgare]|nr:hypothetical protein ZWY2020_010142 [Hordeum vulgare]
MFSMPPPLLLGRRHLQPSTPRPPLPPPHARHGGHLKPSDSLARVSDRRSAASPRLAAPAFLLNVAKAKICGNNSNMNCLHLRTHQAADDMTLKAFQRSAYMLKPRKKFKRYSPDDYAKVKNPVAGGSRLSRMRSMDDEVEDDDDDESDDPE